MKKTFCIFAVILLISLCMAACSSKKAQENVQENTTGENVAAENMTEENSAEENSAEGNSENMKKYATGTPWPMIDLDGVVTEDTPVDVKDNFALFANKEDILSTDLPADFPFTGTMANVILAGDDDIRHTFEGDEPKSHGAKLAYNLYKMMMDWDSRNKVGVEPLKKQVDGIESLDTIDKLNDYICSVPPAELGSLPWSAGASADYEDSSKNVIMVDDSGLLLQDSDEYTKLTENGQILKDAKSKLAKRMLVKLGYTEEEAQQKIDNAFAFETMLAPYIYSRKERQREDYYERKNNHFSRKELEEAQGKLPILELLHHTGYPKQEDYVVGTPDYIKKLNEYYTDENLPLIRDLMIVKNVSSAASDLDRECYEWNNDCGNEIEGTEDTQEDEVAFSQYVSGQLSWQVAQLYTEAYLKEEDKKRITKLVEEIKEAYHGILEDADFLSDETKKKAIEKLEAIDARVLYPDSWEKYDCDDLDFKGPKEGGRLWDALQAIEAYKLQEEVKDFTNPVDKEKWSDTPQRVNCSYDPRTNSMYILGGYAKGEIYNSDMSDEEVMAKLGTTIGHEISHAFDRTGAQFDKNGDMKNWWTKEDKEEFKKRNAKLADYYNAIHPWEGQDLHGESLTGEACADMAGMKVILKIASEKENFDYDKFFRAYANLWLTKENLTYAMASVEDVHPLNYLRINCTLQQYDDFLDYYGISKGDNMYLAPEDRVNIW